jgi:cell division protein FtsQ
MPTIVGGICTRLGLAVDEVRVTGNRETSEIDLIQSLELDGSTSLIGLDAHAARQRVDRLPWVKTASVRKIYPDAIAIDIEEREPFAVWQNGGRLTIIERSGVPIAPFSGGRHAALPLVLGLGAPEAAADFLSKVSRHPEIAARVRGYIRVGDRRWDLRLENGLTVKLPEHGEEKALAELAAMEEAQAILSRDILTIDMRIEDRVVFKLTPEAALRRNATLEEQRKQERRRHI